MTLRIRMLRFNVCNLTGLKVLKSGCYIRNTNRRDAVTRGKLDLARSEGVLMIKKIARHLRLLLIVIATIAICIQPVASNASTVFTDPLNNWSLVSTMTANLGFDTTNPSYFNGDGSRAIRTVNDAEDFTYALSNISAFTIIAWTDTSSISQVNIWYSTNNGASYSVAAYTVGSRTATSGGWGYWTINNSGSMPLGVTNLEVQLLPGSSSTGDPEIGSVSITYSGSGSVPSAPTGLTATAGNGQVALSWSASSGATSYNIYRSTTSGGEGATAYATATSTSYTDTSAVNGTAYYYTVAAVNATGTSAQSSQVSATPVAAAPAAPTGLTATAGNAQVALSWTASSGATTYNVYRATTSGGEGTSAVATGITTTTYTNSGLTNGVKYYFTVAAVNTGGTSAQSGEASATPVNSIVEAPYGGTAAAIPGTVQAENYDTGGQGVAYNIPTNSGTATSYRTDGVDLEVCTDTGGGYDVGWTAAGQWMKYTVNVATAGTYTISFRLAAMTAVAGGLHISNSAGTNLTGEVSVPATGGWQTWTTVTATVTLPAGQQVLTVNQDVAGWNLNYVTFAASGTAPATPTGLTATAGNAQVSLSWTASSGATSYNVYRSTTSGGEGTTVYATTTSTNYTNSGLTNGTVYYYTVAAVNAIGTSAQSSQVSATPVAAAPAAPTGLTATAGNAQVALSWTASSGATTYNVYRATTSGGEGTSAVATGITTTTYTNSGLTNGVKYYFTVAAVNTGGTSAQSGEASATPVNSIVEAPYGGTAAAIPGTVQAENYDTGGQGVAYNIPTNSGTATSYRTDGVDLEVCTDTGGGYDVGWTAAGQWMKYTVNVATAGTYTISFRLAAMTAVAGGLHISNSAGTNLTGEVSVPATGGWQTWTTVTATVTLPAGQQVLTVNQDVAGWNLNYMTFAASGTAPATPTGLTAVAGNAQVSLSWTASSGATSYNVYRSTTSGGEGTTVYATTTSTTYANTGLTNGTAYFYTVAAVNAIGTSAQSSQVSATPALAVPGTPTGLTATGGVGEIVLAWTAGSNATTYSVYRSTTSGGEGTTVYATTTSTSYTDTAVATGIVYYYKVASVNSSGTSAQSTEASATPTIPIGPAPGAPSGLTANGGNAQIVLAWTAGSNATSYSVYRGTVSGGESDTPIATDVTTTSYTDSTTVNGTTYYYVVEAVNTEGTSSDSNEASATAEVITSSSDVPAGYTLAWSDEFNQGVGATPNQANWNYDTGIGPNNDGWGNWEQQTYVSDQAHAHIIADPQASDGQSLQIQATNDDNWATYGFHSVRLNSIGKVLPEYGYIELRAKLPSGQGIWPAFWALGNNMPTVGWPECGEMDMMEMFGQNPTTDFASYHMEFTDPEINWTATDNNSTFQSNYHIFGLLWTPTGVTNYVDGAQFETNPSSSHGWVFNQPFYMLLNLAVGGTPPGDVTQTGTTFPQNLDVDYVRIYEPGNGAPTGLYANPGTAQVSLAWTPAVGPATYLIYRGTTPGGEAGAPIASGVTTPAYLDTTVTNGVTYYYKIAAVTPLGTTPQSAEVSAAPAAAPNFGPNVLVFTPSMNTAAIQLAVNSIFNQQVTNQFGTTRYALLFAPGSYNLDINVGFYTQVLGLGALPGSTLINGYVATNAEWNYTNATDNFWRGIENLTINPDDSAGTDEYAVSQACPMRRVHVEGNLLLADEDWLPLNPGYASGGFLADSQIDDEAESISQQQWFTRNSSFASWSNGVWNQVFVGDAGAPATEWPTPTDNPVINPYTTVANTPVIREKPFLYVDSSGNYWVSVPSLRTNVQGTSWSSGTEAGTSIPISSFYIAHAGTDNATTINAALNAGLNILFTPGVYALGGTIQVNNANTVLLGLGLATLQANTGQTAIQVADVGGVTVAGLLIEAASNVTGNLMQVGPTGSSASHATNPTLLADLFFRIGGAVIGQAGVSLQINSSNVIGDDFWIWRADHGLAGTVGWTINTATNGLVVNGQNVTIYGLAVEHFQQYQTLWNGNGGQTYFYQSEAPYDVPVQADWMDGAIDGFASYKVANTVTSHQAYGLGIYCYFDVNPSGVTLTNAIEAPTTGVSFTDIMTDSLGGVGTISSIINGTGLPVTNNGGTANETAFLATYP